MRTHADGDPVREWMPAAMAVADVLYNEDNGRVWASARIVTFDDVDLGEWDRSL